MDDDPINPVSNPEKFKEDLARQIAESRKFEGYLKAVRHYRELQKREKSALDLWIENATKARLD